MITLDDADRDNGCFRVVPGSHREGFLPGIQDGSRLGPLFTDPSAFDAESQMIGPPEHTWMINFRVNDLDAMVEQLRAASVEVEVDSETYPNGRFAQTEDPEGNRIQLWEPSTV